MTFTKSESEIGYDKDGNIYSVWYSDVKEISGMCIGMARSIRDADGKEVHLGHSMFAAYGDGIDLIDIDKLQLLASIYDKLKA